MIDINAIYNAYVKLRNNPSEFLGIPSQFTNSPEDAIQYLMNNGRVSQQQYNEATAKIKQLQNNPMFKQFFK